MKLPDIQLATVPERKVTHYLLNPTHPTGGSKASFFLRFGFSATEWRRLAEALLAHARENEVVESEQTPHGYPPCRRWPLDRAGRHTLEYSQRMVY